MATLGTLDERGRAHLVPVVFALDGERLVTAVDHKPKRTERLKRLENIRRHAEVTVLVDHYEEDWDALWWVRLRGSARVVEPSEPEHRELVATLAARYSQYRGAAPAGPAIVVEISEWSGWTASPASS